MVNANLITELQTLRAKNKELTSATIPAKKAAGQSSKPLLPATEAQRLIDQNKATIAKLDEQLKSYNTGPTGGNSQRPISS